MKFRRIIAILGSVGSCAALVQDISVDERDVTISAREYSPYLYESYPDQAAFYYVRVLEIPTPTWLAYDRVQLGADVPEEGLLVHQERAYTSPIWYTP